MTFSFFILIFLISACLLIWLLKPFIASIILALIIASASNPVYSFLKKTISQKKASFLSCLLLLIILLIPTIFFISALSKETYDLYVFAKNAVWSQNLKIFLQEYNLLGKINTILSKFGTSISAEDLIKQIAESGKFVSLFLLTYAKTIAANAFTLIGHLALTLFITYFLFIDRKKLFNFILSLSPLTDEENTKIIDKFKDISGAILIGNGLGGLIQGVAGGICFAAFGFKSPIVWGLIMGICAFLPVIGIGVVLLPTILILILGKHYAISIFLFFFYIILSVGIEYIFKPKLVGDRVKIHPLVLLLTILAGLKAFGFLGIIYGPLIASFFLTLTDIYHKNYEKHIFL